MKNQNLLLQYEQRSKSTVENDDKMHLHPKQKVFLDAVALIYAAWFIVSCFLSVASRFGVHAEKLAKDCIHPHHEKPSGISCVAPQEKPQGRYNRCHNIPHPQLDDH